MQNNNQFGGHSMVANLQRVMVRRPNQALANADPQLWHYTSQIDLTKALDQHNDFTKILRDHHVEVIDHTQESDVHADAIFVHDPALITNQGAIILRMGKALRHGEETLIKNSLKQLNIPIIGELTAPALAEGGDTLWLDEKTLLVGKGFRTNEQGVQQLRDILLPMGASVVDFDLCYFQGKEACLHLQSFISLVNVNTALVYKPLLPTRLFSLLEERNFKMIEVPENEFSTMGSNVLAIQPDLVLSLDTNPITKMRLEQAGVTVLTYHGSELSLKTEGGPTCLTRPIKRA